MNELYQTVLWRSALVAELEQDLADLQSKLLAVIKLRISPDLRNRSLPEQYNHYLLNLVHHNLPVPTITEKLKRTIVCILKVLPRLRTALTTSLLGLVVEYYTELASWYDRGCDWRDHFLSKLNASGVDGRLGNDWTEKEWYAIERAVNFYECSKTLGINEFSDYGYVAKRFSL